MDEWINKMWYTHSMEYYSVFKKDRNYNTCYNMDKPWSHLEKEPLSWDQSEKKEAATWRAGARVLEAQETANVKVPKQKGA